MADRKNIFLIGRRRMHGDEDQLTEMLAFLWQEAPEALERWLETLGLPTDVSAAAVETQFTIPSGKRPDIMISGREGSAIVESKLSSGFGETQIGDYLDYLSTMNGRRALILLTERPEAIPAKYEDQARKRGVALVSTRWHDMSECLADPGEESLAGDFVQLLIREGLVKPESFSEHDWKAWNGGYNVLLRLDSFLTELDPFVRQLNAGAKWKSTSGLSKRWIYKVWRTGSLELGLGFGAAAEDSQPHSDPIAFAIVGWTAASEDDAMRAVGVEKGTRWKWSVNDEMKANCGLMYSNWPSLARPVADVLRGETFEEQLQEATRFLGETAAFFQNRGFLPRDIELAIPIATAQ